MQGLQNSNSDNIPNSTLRACHALQQTANGDSLSKLHLTSSTTGFAKCIWQCTMWDTQMLLILIGLIFVCIICTTEYTLGCTKIHESQNFKVAVSQNTLFYLTKSLQKQLGFSCKIAAARNLAKVPVFECQKIALRAPKSSNRLQKPCKTPPKMVR